MSYIFEVGDTTVWSPGLRVGALYTRMAECLAEWVGVSSGLSKMANDYYIVDAERFAAFIQALLTDPSSGHPIFNELTRGFIATSMVMLNRAGVSPHLPDASGQHLAELASSVAARMPV